MDSETEIRYINCLVQIKRLRNGRNRLDCTKLSKAVTDKSAEISKELVRCRASNKKTRTFSKLHDEICELVSNLEQFLIIAMLSEG